MRNIRRAASWRGRGLLLLVLLPVAAGAQGPPPSAPVSSAARGFSLGVNPPLIDLVGSPGARKTFGIKVRNYDPLKPLLARLWPADVIQQANGAVTFRERMGYEYSCVDWLELGKREVLIPPGQEVEVPVTLTVPGGNTRGSFHAIIAVSGHPPESVNVAPETENQAFGYMRVAFGVIVHFNVAGTLLPHAQIDPMYISPTPDPASGLTEATAPAKRWLVVPLRNTGNSMIYGYGWALLRNKGSGGLVQRWRVGQKEFGERVVVYPGRRIALYLPLDRPLPAGEYTAQVRLDYDKHRAASGTSTFEITPEQAQQGYARLSGPFQSLTIGLSLAVNNEMTAISAAPGGFRTGWVTVMNHEDAHVQVTAEAVDTVMDADGVLSPHV
ncbi:MAG: hypothetical protein GX100_05355, partial [candidate division WS1 bacterium]|nr:hypothetical protein [candidate division WS1 bacterium]